MSITVYTKPDCVQCNATKRKLDKQGLDYTTVDVIEDPAAADNLKALGFASVPVVIADDVDPWAGYRPDKVKALAK